MTPTEQLRTACEDFLRYMDIPDCGRTEAPLEALRAALTAVSDEEARFGRNGRDAAQEKAS